MLTAPVVAIPKTMDNEIPGTCVFNLHRMTGRVLGRAYRDG
jgi:hypothetical protein